MMSKLICEECDWHGQDEDMLTAINPFDKDDTIIGCPKCFAINTLLPACDVPECWQVVSCGTPTPGGYKKLVANTFGQ